MLDNNPRQITWGTQMASKPTYIALHWGQHVRHTNGVVYKILTIGGVFEPYQRIRAARAAVRNGEVHPEYVTGRTVLLAVKHLTLVEAA